MFQIQVNEGTVLCPVMIHDLERTPQEAVYNIGVAGTPIKLKHNNLLNDFNMDAVVYDTLVTLA